MARKNPGQVKEYHEELEHPYSGEELFSAFQYAAEITDSPIVRKDGFVNPKEVEFFRVMLDSGPGFFKSLYTGKKGLYLESSIGDYIDLHPEGGYTSLDLKAHRHRRLDFGGDELAEKDEAKADHFFKNLLEVLEQTE